MIGPAIIEQFIARGFDPAEAAARGALLAQAQAMLLAHTGQAPAWAWVVPGRIEIFGKHTDYAGGCSLVATVPRGFVVVASPRDDARVTVLDARWRQRLDIDIADGPQHGPGWANYVSTVVSRLATNFPGAALGTTLAINSDLPRAAGLSSSSALVVAVALALIRRSGLETRDEWPATISNRLDLAGYLGAIESGLAFGPWPGARGVGTHGGSEDHTAILNARPGHVSAFRYLPVRHLGDVEVPPSWRFIVMTSGIRADKTGSVRDRYNRASLMAQRLCEVYHAHTTQRFVSLAALLESEPGARDWLRQWLDADERRRLDHFDAENQRVLEAVEAFDRADSEAMGLIADASQADAAERLGNQITETIRLSALARDAGAFAATSFGAGFGGSVWALADAGDADEVAVRWQRAYLAEWPAIREVEWFISRPAPAAIELQL